MQIRWIRLVGRKRLCYNAGTDIIIRWMFENRLLQGLSQLIDGMIRIHTLQFHKRLRPLLGRNIFCRSLDKYQLVATLAFSHDVTIYSIYYRFFLSACCQQIALAILAHADFCTKLQGLFGSVSF